MHNVTLEIREGVKIELIRNQKWLKLNTVTPAFIEACLIFSPTLYSSLNVMKKEINNYMKKVHLMNYPTKWGLEIYFCRSIFTKQMRMLTKLGLRSISLFVRTRIDAIFPETNKIFFNINRILLMNKKIQSRVKNIIVKRILFVFKLIY